MSKQPSIRCDRIQVGYDGRSVIRNADLTLYPGEILTLIGPNGSGKSTLLKTLSRILPLQAGTVYLSGKDLSSYKSRDLAKKMAVLLTRGKDPGMITCREVIAMGRFPYTNMAGILSEEDERIITRAMEQTGVEDLAAREYDQISDGQRQRVLLARALCQEPEILLLDEPISYLDIKYKLEFLDALQKLVRQRDLTVVMSLHELDLAERVSHRIACVKDGGILKVGTPEEVMGGSAVEMLFDLPEDSYDSASGSVEMKRITGDAQIFVLCGTGNGTGIFRALQRREIPFDAGILWSSDRDMPAARALAQNIVESAPFGPPDQETVQTAKERIDACRFVVSTLEGSEKLPLTHPLEELRQYAENQGKLRTLEELLHE